MNTRSTIGALMVALLASGCVPGPEYIHAQLPPADIGQTRAHTDDVGSGQPDGDAWSPYPGQGHDVQKRRDTRTDPDFGYGPRDDAPVTREDLPAPADDASVPSSAPQRPYASVAPSDSAFRHVEAKDPPADLDARRTPRLYSSVPGKVPQSPKPVATASAATAAAPVPGASKVKSDWADKAVRDDNRPAFDDMVRSAGRGGKAQFEDEAGRVYFGERGGVDGGCTVVNVVVTTNGGLPVVSRGSAYICR